MKTVKLNLESDGPTKVKDALTKYFPNNDAGRSQRFCERWREEIRYIPEKSSWLTWEGRWVKDINGGLKRRAMRLSDEMLTVAMAKTDHTEEEASKKNAAKTSAIQLGNEKQIRPMLNLAEAEIMVQARVSDLDANKYLLGTPNAIVDLTTGEARPHWPGAMVTRCTRAEYNPLAQAPRWQQFLEEVFPDAELRRWVWKAVGYSITGSMEEEVFFVCYQSGRNGKSKFINGVTYALGEYADTAGTALVVANDRGEDPKREKAELPDIRFLRAPELEDDNKRYRLNTRIIKDITGGDPISGEAKYQHPVTFSPCCKLWWPCNGKPSISEVGEAIWSRVRLIPFERYFAPEERDTKLEEKLQAEAEGILAWCVQGALLWRQEGLKDTPAKVLDAVEEYRKEEDKLAPFIEEMIEHPADTDETKNDVYEAYSRWADNSGIRYSLTKIVLGKQLMGRGWVDGNSSKGRVWRSVRIVREP
jgi:putative DNA primase/helicase